MVVNDFEITFLSFDQMEEFKFVLFTERIFKNKKVFKLAHGYDFLCAVTYIFNEMINETENIKKFMTDWRLLSESIFKDLLRFDSSNDERIELLDKYLTEMKSLIKNISNIDLDIVHQAYEFLMN